MRSIAVSRLSIMLGDQLDVPCVRAGSSFSKRCVRHGDREPQMIDAPATKDVGEPRENTRDEGPMYKKEACYLRFPATVLGPGTRFTSWMRWWRRTCGGCETARLQWRRGELMPSMECYLQMTVLQTATRRLHIHYSSYLCVFPHHC